MIGFLAPFQILDYLDRLKVVKETSNEYHCLCPVCDDGGFKVNKKEWYVSRLQVSMRS